MGLSPSKAVIDKLSVASARASHEGREDIQSLLFDDDFIDNLHGLWQQIPSTLQSRIAPTQQREAVSPNKASQRKRSAASMLATYKNRGNCPARCKAVTLNRKRRRRKTETTAYKIRKRQLYLQTVGRRQKETLVKSSGLKRRPETKRKGQMRQTMDTESDELQQLVKNIGRWKSDIPGFFREEEVSELILYNALVGTYRLLRHLEQRTVRDEVRIRLLKVMFHRLLEKVCNQYARPKDLERVTRIISISGLVDDDSEQIGKRINSWGKIGRRLELLCKDLSDGHPKNEQHLGILFRLPKMSDNYLAKLGYKSLRRKKEIQRFKKSGLCSKEKFKEVDEFAGHAFSYLWERVQAAIIQESLPADEQLPDEPTESDQAESQTGSSHQVTVPTARTTSSAENRTGQSIIQPVISEGCVMFSASPLTQRLQSDTEVQFNGAMPDQMEGDVWPFMQRIPGFSNSGSMDMQSATDSQILASECAMFNSSPSTQPLQSDTEVQFNGAMPDQMEGDVWPFMQRICTHTTAHMEDATTTTTNQYPLEQDSALHNRDPGGTDAQLRGSERFLPHSLGIWARARMLDCNLQSYLSSNTPAENHAASKYQSRLVDQYPVFSYGEMGRHHSNNQCGNYPYIAPITALEA